MGLTIECPHEPKCRCNCACFNRNHMESCEKALLSTAPDNDNRQRAVSQEAVSSRQQPANGSDGRLWWCLGVVVASALALPVVRLVKALLR